MRNVLILLILGLFLSACETMTEGKVEGEPIQFEGSFLIQGENVLASDNPNPLYDYADHMNIEGEQIKEMSLSNVTAEITDKASDSLLVDALHLMITAKDMDTLKVASIDTVHSSVVKHELIADGTSNILPYLRAEDPNWLLMVNLNVDYEETLPFRITMDYDVKYAIR